MGLVVLIERAGLRVAADRKIVKRAEAVVVQDVAEAYAVAQQRIAAAQAAEEQACAQRAQDAFREGMAKAQREAAQRLTLIEVDRLALLQSLRPALVDVIVDAVALLATGIDRRLIIARALETLDASLRNTSWARLRVHPQSAQAAQDALSEFDRAAGLGNIARVVADESLPLDGCVLESEFGKVDASLSTQLEVIREAIAHAANQMTVPATTH